MNAASRLIVPAAIAGLFLWLFAEALFGGGMFAVRDAAHFYDPLFQFVQDEWAAGRVPLWNPYENLGQPLLADATSSVFYPGKLIFALPLGYAWAHKIYILGHVLFAAVAAYTLARHWRASTEAAGICAISYAFSGNVLFDYCNVVFLIGAAWLPLAMLTAERMLVDRTARWAVAFGVVLALMVLGGDPQMAYHAGLLAAGYAALLWWQERGLRGCNRPHPSPLPEGEGTAVGLHPDPFPKGEGTAICPLPQGHGIEVRTGTRSRLVLLALAAAMGLLLAAIQIVPSLEFTHYSNRIPGSLAERLLGRLEPESHLDYVYRFSVGPWRLAEYLWPNLSGRQFPVHRRWLDVLPAEGHPWTPSLYMGVLPLLLAGWSIRLRRAAAREIWLSWSVLLAVAASFGWYGLGWLWHEVRTVAGAADVWPVGPPLGGLYWLLTLVLPGYVTFRYPAKLLVIAAMGLSVLAARGWDRALAGESDRLRRWLLWLASVSLCGVAAALVIRPLWPHWLAGAEPDKLFGPLDAAGALHDLATAFGQTAIVCGLFWCLLKAKRGHSAFSQTKENLPFVVPGKKQNVPFSVAALLLVAADLAVANGWMVVCAPARLWEEPSAMAAAIRRAEKEAQELPCRVYRHPLWTPPAWQAVSSSARLSEAVAWDRDTLWPKYNLRPRISLADVPGAMMLRDYEQYLAAAGGADEICQAVGAEYAILPGNQALPGWQRSDVGVADASLWRDPRPSPRVWIAHDAEQGLPRPPREPKHCPPLPLGEGRGEGAGDSARGIEGKTGAANALTLTLSQRERGLDEWCRIAHYDPLRVEIEARLSRPGWVVLADQFYPGWQLEVETKGGATRRLPIVRASQVMRGAQLPAGEHRLVYRYRPASFVWGALLSGLGWIGVAAWAIVRYVPRQISTDRFGCHAHACRGHVSCRSDDVAWPRMRGHGTRTVTG